MADRDRAVGVNDQFAIASLTKPVVATQVMQMVESGELGLGDPVANHLPADLDFDTNGATIRDLLGHHSGIPDYYPAVHARLSKDLQHAWTPTELLGLVGPDREPAGEIFEYGDTNYLLLGLVIEHVRGRPLASVLREDVLDIDGVERLIYQPDEAPTEPMAMPFGRSTAVLNEGGGFLPSIAHVTSDGPGAAMASDAPSLVRWWRALCAGEIVSQASLTEMATFEDGYGLGLYNPGDPYADVVGHTGSHDGYVSWAGCLPEDGAVVVVLTNQVVDDIGLMAEPLVGAVRDLSD
jgi:D-alanyl-D-alanine carboxypeptidase